MIKISVIVPIYNMERYLDCSLGSIINQTIFPEMEIICVNDGSKDKSKEILSLYEKRYRNIVIVDQENTGVGIARNNGIKKAKGEFIAFLDPDDYYLENDTLEILYKKAKEHDVAISGGSMCENHEDKWIRKEFEGFDQKLTFVEEKLIDYKDYQYDYGFYRFIYSREFLLNNNIYFPPYARFQDPPFFVKAMMKAKRFYAIPNYIYCYRCSHKRINWNERLICDLIKGFIDNLRLSADARLGDLHATTLKHFIDHKGAIIQGFIQGVSMVPELLYEAEKSVKKDILPNNSEIKSVWEFYFEYFREAEKNKQLSKDLAKAKEEIVKIKMSRTYKFGEKVLFIPKKIKRMLKK